METKFKNKHTQKKFNEANPATVALTTTLSEFKYAVMRNNIDICRDLVDDIQTAINTGADVQIKLMFDFTEYLPIAFAAGLSYRKDTDISRPIREEWEVNSEHIRMLYLFLQAGSPVDIQTIHRFVGSYFCDKTNTYDSVMNTDSRAMLTALVSRFNESIT